VVKTPDEILSIYAEANAPPKRVGLITWMHTFSPAKMWVAGLSILDKPFTRLHTQVNRNIPWDEIMKRNQSAHGDREFGPICSRLEVSQRRACKVLAQPRGTQRYRPRRVDQDNALVGEMKRFSRLHPRYGCRRITVLLR
jgi:L-arabinose isomerase